MKKIAALDCGDAWTGTALSDALCMLARPYETIPSKNLIPFIEKLISAQRVGTIVVGYPQTMRGGESAQTQKTVHLFESLKEKFPTIKWSLWDERLTSKNAATIKREKTAQDKRLSHSVAAALILTSYLDHLRFEQEFGEQQ